jgi:hypothetical protein
MKFVETTPIATAALTMIRGSVIMEALAVAGKYSDRMTPSHGINIPMRNSYINKANSEFEKDVAPVSWHIDGMNNNNAEKK